MISTKWSFEVWRCSRSTMATSLSYERRCDVVCLLQPVAESSDVEQATETRKAAAWKPRSPLTRSGSVTSSSKHRRSSQSATRLTGRRSSCLPVCSAVLLPQICVTSDSATTTTTTTDVDCQVSHAEWRHVSRVTCHHLTPGCLQAMLIDVLTRSMFCV